MTVQPITPEEIIELLTKLKDKTPEYPADLIAARKTAFLEQAVSINIQPKGPGSEFGGGSGGGGSGLGGSGSGLFGGMSTIQGILLQAVIGVWVIAAMLTAAYVFRDQIIELLQDNEIIEVTQAPPASVPPVTAPPLPDISPTEVPFTEPPLTEPSPASVELGPDGVPVETVIVPDVEATPGDPSNGQESPGALKENPGLHLGQTPGAPEAPGQEDNTEKPAPPDKPDKPDKSNQPDGTQKDKTK